VKERHHLEDVGAVGRIILKLILEVCGESVWPGFVCLRTGTNAGLLWMRQWTFGFYKMWGINW
jgi:hypothetical protein